MKVYNKAQINIKNLTDNDELVTYTASNGCSCIKMRVINGKKALIIDRYSFNGLSSNTHNTLTEAKKYISHCNHQ